MATIEQRYNIEGAVETAASYLLTTNGINNVIHRAKTLMETPYVDIEYTNGQSRELLYSSGSVYINRRWDGQLLFTIITDRNNNSGSHSTYRSYIRYIFSNFSAFNSGSLMPSHVMVDLKETQTVNEVTAEDDTDVSAITFNTVVDIKTI